MNGKPRALRDRLLPSVLTAAGVTLLAAGLLSYSGSAAAADPSSSAGPSIMTADPGASLFLPTLPPIGPTASIGPGSSTGSSSTAVATRVVIEALGIDLPVVRPAGGSTTYPQCNVAMYIQDPPFAQPGSGRSTYLYAHARDGMFGPIYERAILDRSGGPTSMIGMIVQVYTSDNQLHEYAISQVLLHQLTLDGPARATSEELWLQTSEGPKGTPGKTQLLALPLIVLPADPAAAHPTARPVTCG